MIKILLVEDEMTKLSQITQIVRKIHPNAEIIECKSFNSAIRNIREHKNHIDIILMDMSLPTFDVNGQEDGGRPRTFGGKEIFRYMHRWQIRSPVIVITQFDHFGQGADEVTLADLTASLTIESKGLLSGVVHYNNSIDEWKKTLLELMSTGGKP